jgi:hypothetical protein
MKIETCFGRRKKMREQVGAAPKSLKQRCPQHGSVCHVNKQDAEAACAVQVAAAKNSGAEGKAYRRLNVYTCDAGNGWHVGHAKQSWPENKPAEPQRAKPLSPGQLRRKIEHAEREQKRHEERAAYFAEQIENLKHIDWLYACEVAATARELAGKPTT